jgi:hypothetical protein
MQIKVHCLLSPSQFTKYNISKKFLLVSIIHLKRDDALISTIVCIFIFIFCTGSKISRTIKSKLRRYLFVGSYTEYDRIEN